MKEITATLALILKEPDQVLLAQKIRKGPVIGEGKYNGPGGKLEAGQTLLECLQTETFQEVGITIPEDGAEEVAVITFHNGTSSIFKVHVYLVHAWEGEPRNSDEMVEPVEGWWHKIGAIPFHQMLVSDQEWMPLVLSGRRFHANVFQNDAGTELTGKTEYTFL